MVELEDSKLSSKEKNNYRNRPVYKDWKDIWIDIDNKLEELNQTDATLTSLSSRRKR